MSNPAKIGEIRKHSSGYFYQKVERPTGGTTWRPRANVIMEEHIGRPLRPGEYVTFNDGDKGNFDLANLELKERMPAREYATLRSLTNRLTNLERQRVELIERYDALAYQLGVPPWADRETGEWTADE